MRGNYIDLARYLDRVQKGCRVRIIKFGHLQFLVNKVKRGEDYASIDGGKMPQESCYPGQTTLALVARNSENEIIIGIQRCKAESGAPWGVYYTPRLNRGMWEIVSRDHFNIADWAAYYGPEQRFVLESTGLQV